MEDTYNIWYLKHIEVSIFKSIKVSDFFLGLLIFLCLLRESFADNTIDNNNNNRTDRSV